MAEKHRGRIQFVGRTFIDRSHVGGNTDRAFDIAAEALAGTTGYRQGAQQINMNRASGQDFANGWDGNPDNGLKIIATNRAANAASRGGVRALDIQARNRGTNMAWVKTLEINGRNDSGKTIDTLNPVHIRAENYGTVETDIVGLDVEMASENDGGSPTKDGILVRNNDQSGMTAVGAVIKVSHHASSGGFTNLIRVASATNDSFTAKTTAVADLGSTVGYFLVDIAGTARRIPVFTEWS